MGFGPPSPSREECWRDCSEVFPCEPLRVFVRRSCSGAGFGRAACAGRIRCTRPARLGTRRKARARACAGGCGRFRVFRGDLRLESSPACSALRRVPEGLRRGSLCWPLRVFEKPRLASTIFPVFCKELRNLRGYGIGRPSFACAVLDAL